MKSVALLCLPLAACQVFFNGDDDTANADAAPVVVPDARELTPDAAPDARPDDPDAAPDLCDVTVRQFAPAASPHVSEGSTVVYDTNPPNSGPHYPYWARWDQSYGPGALARPYWVHNLEHGGVVFLYKCPDGCADVVGKLQTLEDSLPADPLCTAQQPPLTTRTLIAADELLPDGVQVAASAWGFTYTAKCFDAASLRAFYLAHFGHATESLCAQGARP